MTNPARNAKPSPAVFGCSALRLGDEHGENLLKRRPRLTHDRGGIPVGECQPVIGAQNIIAGNFQPGREPAIPRCSFRNGEQGDLTQPQANDLSDNQTIARRKFAHVVVRFQHVLNSGIFLPPISGVGKLGAFVRGRCRFSFATCFSTFHAAKPMELKPSNSCVSPT